MRNVWASLIANKHKQCQCKDLLVACKTMTSLGETEMATSLITSGFGKSEHNSKTTEVCRYIVCVQQVYCRISATQTLKLHLEEN